MTKINRYTVLILLLIFAKCTQVKEDCYIREWKVIDVYSNSYPLLLDTFCNSKIVLLNKTEVDKTILDSIFVNIKYPKNFSIDTLGSYEIVASTIVEVNGVDYRVAKVRYLAKGYNIDQEFLFWVVKDKGVYIQQENDKKKLFLLKKISNKKGQVDSPEKIVEQIMKDTILFPLPPSLR